MRIEQQKSVVQPARLPVWLAASVALHMLLVSIVGGSTAPRGTSFPVITVDILQAHEEPAAGQILTEAPMPDLRSIGPAHNTASAGAKPVSRSAREAPFPGPSYFDDVDVPAQPANDVLLRYPWIEYRQHLGGVVRIALLINEHGRLDKATVVDASPAGHFEEAAMEAVRKLQFTPALKRGQPVKSRKTIEVVFDPSEDLNQPGRM